MSRMITLQANSAFFQRALHAYFDPEVGHHTPSPLLKLAVVFWTLLMIL